MVRQRISIETPIKLEEVADNLSPERTRNPQRAEQDKADAIHNWLNSKICGKAC